MPLLLPFQKFITRALHISVSRVRVIICFGLSLITHSLPLISKLPLAWQRFLLLHILAIRFNALCKYINTRVYLKINIEFLSNREICYILRILLKNILIQKKTAQFQWNLCKFFGDILILVYSNLKHLTFFSQLDIFLFELPYLVA